MHGIKSFLKRIVLTLVVTSLMIGPMGLAVQEVRAGPGWVTAYKVGYTHWDEGQPHYGAYFTGSNGAHQYYTGASGQPAGYSSWNWWGNSYHVLLCSLTWLLLYPVEAWIGSNHHAYMYSW